MRKCIVFVGTTVLMLIGAVAHGQSWQEAIGPTEHNFFEIKEKAEQWFAERNAFKMKDLREIPRVNGERNFDKEYHKFQRWVWFWQDRVHPDGSFPDLRKNLSVYKKSHSKSHQKNIGPQWINITQTWSTSGYNGMGRTTCMAFHPTDVNTWWVGAPNGGIWRTTDGGTTYTSLGDELPYSAVGSIVVDPTNTEVIYLGMGENNAWWEPSIGVMKSVDGGETWSTTGLSWNLSNGPALSKVVMDPTDNLTLMAAADNGMWRTTDGGISWNVVQQGYFADIEYHPTNPSIVYAGEYDYWGNSDVWKSTDAGQSWTKVSALGQTQTNIRLEVTAADPDRLAVMFTGTDELYMSYDAGVTFTYRGSVPATDGMVISQTVANRMYVGQLDVHKSTNGGSSFNQISLWYNGGGGLHTVHADTRNTAYNPLTPNMVWFCNDGGIYRYNEVTDDFEDFSDGLIIMQYYSLACSQTEPQMLIGGTQDNGGRKRLPNGNWVATNGGDAMVTAIDPTDEDVFYTTYVYGELYRTTDGWNNDTYNSISDNIQGGTPPGKWVTPYVIDPNDNETLVAGYDDIYRTTNRGSSWTKISDSLANGATIRTLAVAPSNSSVIYAAVNNRIYKTSNLGSSWQMYNPPLPSSVEISSIAVHPNDPDQIWFTLTGFINTKKVYYSPDGGLSWSNWTGSLPNFPVNTIIYEDGSNDAMFIGTDIGVYYRNANMSDWIFWSVGMPNTVVTDFDIQYSDGIIRASTYGRGILERDLCDDNIDTDNDGVTDCQDLCPEDPDKLEPGDCGCGIPDTPICAVVGIEEAPETAFSIYPNPTNGELTVDIAAANGQNYQLEVLNVQGQRVSEVSRVLPGNNVIDLSSLSEGLYWLRFTAGDEQHMERIVITK